MVEELVPGDLHRPGSRSLSPAQLPSREQQRPDGRLSDRARVRRRAGLHRHVQERHPVRVRVRAALADDERRVPGSGGSAPGSVSPTSGCRENAARFGVAFGCRDAQSEIGQVRQVPNRRTRPLRTLQLPALRPRRQPRNGSELQRLGNLAGSAGEGRLSLRERRQAPSRATPGALGVS
jgi:hypothetical protein